MQTAGCPHGAWRNYDEHIGENCQGIRDISLAGESTKFQYF